MATRRIAPGQAAADPAHLVPLTSPISDSAILHRALLAYASDFHLIGTATLPHGISYLTHNVQMASLDHALWFHRPFRVDDWLLYSFDSPTAQGAPRPGSRADFQPRRPVGGLHRAGRIDPPARRLISGLPCQAGYAHCARSIPHPARKTSTAWSPS
jgi:hypothetical protein